MNKKRIMLLAAVAFVALSASGCGYNTLNAKHQGVRAKWAGVETQLQRRADLIPNLFEAAQGRGHTGARGLRPDRRGALAALERNERPAAR